jgi:uridine kinase
MFYSKRLIRLVIEFALSLMPFETVVVETPQGVKYEGKKCSVTADHICGVRVI